MGKGDTGLSGPEQSRDGVSEATHQGCGYGGEQEVPWALLQGLPAQLGLTLHPFLPPGLQNKLLELNSERCR